MDRRWRTANGHEVSWSQVIPARLERFSKAQASD